MTELLAGFVRKRAEAWLRDEEYLEPFLSESLVANCALPTIPLPAAVEDAVLFYHVAASGPLRGYVRVARLLIDGRDAFVVHVRTNGDDGYLELFDDDGTPLGAARTYMELVELAPTSDVRAFVEHPGKLPEALAARTSDTLWTQAQAVMMARATQKPLGVWLAGSLVDDGTLVLRATNLVGPKTIDLEPVAETLERVTAEIEGIPTDAARAAAIVGALAELAGVEDIRGSDLEVLDRVRRAIERYPRIPSF